ncbi:Glycolipid 2-alpha-mannosyltransferase [Nosema bombycis CQ1]|uniref:Glycolipid 2-alpha-mannosyltransferase n=1 Tax=Nosema bombycis (strain CQ1 / CVCC 102059) TaxID=578461 RepID=R0M8H3_NOSB1|nr:Glycolipid 2-alpha-mannosyltransferase [Nosema bombycis CQ1]|eukprot:EOB14274.1 Glycolipid 2-alpha-mannosyltransferase [Nosema bombycis CQ1]
MLIFSFLISILSKENAVILILCRNSDLENIRDTIINFEDMFNKQFQYPYVFLNDDDFTPSFKKTIESVTSTPVQFGKLSEEEFGVPPFIDMNKANLSMDKLKKLGIIYGDSLSYRKMCRFFSGYFFRNNLVRNFKYYWRIEPEVKFLCKINYDPFEYLKKNEKEYGFVITIKEFMDTIPSLYKETINFLKNNRNLIGMPDGNKFILNQDLTYNGCHFWSNFEIASFDFWRSEIYLRYFKWLDKSGGFFYERWGDAPVHSLALSLFLDKKKIHFFEDLGYRHPPFSHCPSSPSRLVSCNCTPKESIDFAPHSCLRDWLGDILRSM